jgi:hypothetical protein
VKFLATLPDPRDRAYGERLIQGLRQLFGVIHRREDLTTGNERVKLTHLGAK